MQAEIGLAIILIIVLLADLFQKVPSPKNMQRLSCALLVILLLNNLFNSASREAFGSMYINTPMTSVVKTVLTLGTILVFMQADTWLEREDTRHKAGEFYLLTNPEHLKLTDATWDERFAVICLIVAVAGLGLAPYWVSHVISGSVEPIISQLCQL